VALSTPQRHGLTSSDAESPEKQAPRATKKIKRVESDVDEQADEAAVANITNQDNSKSLNGSSASTAIDKGKHKAILRFPYANCSSVVERSPPAKKAKTSDTSLASLFSPPTKKTAPKPPIKSEVKTEPVASSSSSKPKPGLKGKDVAKAKPAMASIFAKPTPAVVKSKGKEKLADDDKDPADGENAKDEDEEEDEMSDEAEDEQEEQAAVKLCVAYILRHGARTADVHKSVYIYQEFQVCAGCGRRLERW
jgi:hypothetical protein